MELLKTEVGGLVFYYLKNDRYIGQRVALGKYEPYETELMLRQVKKGDVVIDVGANIGYYTVLLAKKVGKKGKVYAFEPDSVNFAILEKNIKANKLKNVVAMKVAVGSKNEEKVLYKSEENLGDHRLYETLRPSGTSLDREAIKIIKLDDFIKEPSVAKAMEGRGVDLIKIDTQGWEPEVVEGAKRIIERDKPIMFFEYSPASYKVAKLNGKKMIEFLEKIYKKIFLIDDWFYIYSKKNKKEIDKICSKNKTGYVDLLVKKEMGLSDRIGQFKDIKVKKLIKKFCLQELNHFL